MFYNIIDFKCNDYEHVTHPFLYLKIIKQLAKINKTKTISLIKYLNSYSSYSYDILHYL